MKKIAIVCLFEKTALFIQKQLYSLIGEYVDIHALSLEKTICSNIQSDLVLLGDAAVGKIIHNYIHDDIEMLSMKMTIGKSGFEKLLSIPEKSRVLLVNDTVQSTYDTINLLYEVGIRHLEFIPYYPNMVYNYDVDIAVTPDEDALVPPSIKRIVNIGGRVIDPYMIINILTKLELVNNKTLRDIVFNRTNDYIPRNPQLLDVIASILKSRNHLEKIIEVIDEGIIAYDEGQHIILFNEVAEKIFGIPIWKAKMMTLSECFSEISLTVENPEDLCDDVQSINHTDYIVNAYPLYIEGHYSGGVIRYKEFSAIRRLEKKIRQSSKGGGYIAKNSFDDILGKSPVLRQCRNLAEKMAKGDGAILIEGESGVGKENFAQAIHNASFRHDSPFIAFNCASIPDTLIESELFGYEEGAFTGARKGGKPGLFELANGGTVFLDELGDISPNMQTKLLRVLQEKEIVRVGGQEVIPVDIRIISASNKNIPGLVLEHTFRMDLFYRLNVLSLKIPALRERGDDILLLPHHFLQGYGLRYELSKEAADVLLEYDWPGNIRELQNVSAYIGYMSENRLITCADLPQHFAKKMKKPLSFQQGKGAFQNEDEEMLSILLLLYQGREKGRHIGRKEISHQLPAYGIRLSEGEVRSRLQKLAAAGLAHCGRGRAGTRVTRAGEQCLRESGLL